VRRVARQVPVFDVAAGHGGLFVCSVPGGRNWEEVGLESEVRVVWGRGRGWSLRMEAVVVGIGVCAVIELGSTVNFLVPARHRTGSRCKVQIAGPTTAVRAPYR
jgi:hypothetical protein